MNWGTLISKDLPSNRLEKEGDLSDFECGMVVLTRQSFSETTDLLGFSHTTIQVIQRMIKKIENIQ